MAYFHSRIIEMPFDEAVEKLTESLKSQGFGVLTEINVNEVFAKKLGIEFRKYKILGACNPQYAHQVIVIDDKIGNLLPCNVLVQEKDGKVEISAVDPVAMLQVVGKPELDEMAGNVREMIYKAVDNV